MSEIRTEVCTTLTHIQLSLQPLPFGISFWTPPPLMSALAYSLGDSLLSPHPVLTASVEVRGCSVCVCVWWGTALSPPWKQGTQPPEPICKLPGPRSTPAHLPTCPICRKGWRGQEVKEGSSSRARWEGRLQESWGLRAELWVPSPLKLRPTFNYP